jgi:hypothetical protein
MGAPSDVSGPTRGLCGDDVKFVVCVAFVLLAMVVTMAVMRP